MVYSTLFKKIIVYGGTWLIQIVCSNLIILDGGDLKLEIDGVMSIFSFFPKLFVSEDVPVQNDLRRPWGQDAGCEWLGTWKEPDEHLNNDGERGQD